MGNPENRRHLRENKNQDDMHKKHRTIAIAMTVALVVISVGGLLILNSEGIIDIKFLNRSSSAYLDSDDEFTIEPEATPEFTPEPTEKVYIPDADDIQLPDPQTVDTLEGGIVAEQSEGTLYLEWTEHQEASYYVLVVYNNEYEKLQKDILWSNITKWQVNDFAGGKVILYLYEDNGENGTEDDVVLDAYSYEAEAVVIAGDDAEVAEIPGLNKYYLLVDKASFALGVFTYDENGEYTDLLYTFPCGLGESDRSTVLGVWEISSKGPWKAWSTGWFSPYYCKFTAGLYIHGSVYSEKNFNTLSPTSYEKIGTKSTGGCIRTTVEAAEWIYYNCPAGTVIEIVDYSEVLVYPGKPAVDPDYSNWDPTDPSKPGN